MGVTFTSTYNYMYHLLKASLHIQTDDWVGCLKLDDLRLVIVYFLVRICFLGPPKYKA